MCRRIGSSFSFISNFTRALQFGQAHFPVPLQVVPLVSVALHQESGAQHPEPESRHPGQESRPPEWVVPVQSL